MTVAGSQVANPYSPPSDDIATQGGFKLYSPGHVAWATFLGTPIAGSVLMSMNYRRLGEFTSANLTLAAGFIASIVLLAAAFVLPDDFPASVMSLVYTFTVFLFAKSLQGRSFRCHLAGGGAKASGWKATGIGLLCSVCLVIVIFLVILAVPVEWLGEEY